MQIDKSSEQGLEREEKRGGFLRRIEPKWTWIFIIYFFLAMANLRTKAWVTKSIFDGILERNHNALIAGNYRAPEQYRVLQYWVPEIVHRVTGLGIIETYLLQRLLWTALAFFVFHLYLRKWFDAKVSMIGTIFLSATMQWTYLNHLQESEPLNILIFFAGLWAIREGAFWPLFALTLVGSFNKLTVIFLPVIYFTVWYKRVGIRELALRTGLLLAVVVVICSWLRWYYRGVPYATGFFQIGYNFYGFIASIYLFPFKYWAAVHWTIVSMYGIFWVMAILRWREKPLYLRRAFIVVPLYVICHFLIAKINESRLFLPLAPILIPLGLYYLFPPEEEKG